MDGQALGRTVIVAAMVQVLGQGLDQVRPPAVVCTLKVTEPLVDIARQIRFASSCVQDAVDPQLIKAGDTVAID